MKLVSRSPGVPDWLYKKLSGWAQGTTNLKGLGLQIVSSPHAKWARGVYWWRCHHKIGRMRRHRHFLGFITLTIPQKFISNGGFKDNHIENTVRWVLLHELGHHQNYIDFKGCPGARITKERAASHFADIWNKRYLAVPDSSAERSV